MANEWSRLPNPPGPLFTGDKERKLIKQINQELEERVISQQVLYFPIDLDNSNYHSVYGECAEKLYYNPIRIYCLVDPVEFETETNQFGIDRKQYVNAHFHKRRLTEDQDLFIQEGDIFLYGDNYYEIVELQEAQIIHGQIENKMEVSVKAHKIEDGFFKGPQE